MRALTIRQPWAGLLAAQIKTVENRTWATAYRGPILIHSSAGRADTTDIPAVITSQVPAHLHARGHILASAVIEDCHPDVGCCAPWGEPDVWHWVMGRVRPLSKPTPAKGMLSLWKPGPDLSAAVLLELANPA